MPNPKGVCPSLERWAACPEEETLGRRRRSHAWDTSQKRERGGESAGFGWRGLTPGHETLQGAKPKEVIVSGSWLTPKASEATLGGGYKP